MSGEHAGRHNKPSIVKSDRTRHIAIALAVASGASLMLLATPAMAGTLYWAGSGTGAVGNPPTSGAGGSGQWDNSITADWFDGTAYQTWNSPAGQDIADFRGTAGTVTINSGETVNANKLIFNTSGYVITGDSTTTLQLNNAGTITTNTGTATITAPITAGNMDFEGSGTLSINNAFNFITGAVTVGAGSTVNVVAPANNFSLGNSQTLNGGTLLYSGVAGRSVGSTSTSLSVTANSTLQFNNVTSTGAQGNSGSANYYYAGLSLGANLNIDAQTYQGNFYYGMPTTYFYGGANLTSNATLNISGINAGAPTQINTVNLFNGGISGAYTLTKTGNGKLIVGAGGHYSGLAINAGTMTIPDAGGFPTTSLGFGGGTLNSTLPTGTTITIPATTVTGNSSLNIDQAPQNGGASTYNFGTLALGANLSIAESNPASYYYGQPVITFGATTLSANSTLYVNGGTSGGLVKTTMGPITGAYTITKTGNANLTINTGTGGNYAGLVATAGIITIGDAGGFPTSTLGLSGGSLSLVAAPGATVSDTTVVTTVSVNSAINIDQPASSGNGAGGAANYNLGALNLGANLTIAQPATYRYYYGEPHINFTKVTLSSNATLSVSSGNAGGSPTDNFGPVVGAFTLTTAGNTPLNILAGTTGNLGNYSGLVLGGTAALQINDAGGLPTATLSLTGTGPLTLYAPTGSIINDTTLATTVSAASTINVNQPGSTGAATYNLGSLSLGGNLSIVQPASGNYYYGQPAVNFKATTLTANAVLTTTGGATSTNLGPVTGAFTLTTAGTGTAIVNILAGTGGNYSGLAVTNTGGVQINDAGGLPTGTLSLTGSGPLNLNVPAGVTVADTTLATTVSGSTTINVNQAGSNGFATYNLGPLSIGASTLTLALTTPANYYYGGFAAVNFGATTLTGNTTVVTTGSTFNPTLASVSGAGFGLTKGGSANLTLTGSSTYSGGTTVNAGTLNIAGKTALPVNGSLTIAASANVIALSHTGGATGVVVLQTSTFTNSGKLDLNNNDIAIQSGSTVASITTQVAAGYNNGAWNGTSTGGVITSSTAATDPSHLTAIGIASGLTSYEGLTVPSTDVLVKYTYYGDANLDGAVDGSDYTKIDAGFNSQTSGTVLTGWQNGDFNYDGKIDGSDYTLIDNAFNTQSATLGTNPAALIASSTSQLAGATSSSVPEPMSIGLIGMGLMGLLGRRSRRQG